MTQIRPLTQPYSRRSGELGVHSLDHFNFSALKMPAAFIRPSASTCARKAAG